jgi:Na+/H+-dicarboxylate symporter
MVMVLETVGLPPEDVTIILAVDWLLDRYPYTGNFFVRYTVNLLIPMILVVDWTQWTGTCKNKMHCKPALLDR